MSLLLESIKLLDGEFRHLEYHSERMIRSSLDLFGTSADVDLTHILADVDVPVSGCYKCRIVYDAESSNVSLSPYQVRSVRRVRVVEDNNISYRYKFADRVQLEQLFARRGECDDVLIIQEGRVTDCSYSNVAFRRGEYWYTPAKPLLEGTARARLIRQGMIKPREIRVDDIRSYDSMRIINAMLEFDGPEIDVSDIVF